jgi:hypothetical protein
MKIFASSSLPNPPSNIYPICAENWSNPGVITRDQALSAIFGWQTAQQQRMRKSEGVI